MLYNCRPGCGGLVAGPACCANCAMASSDSEQNIIERLPDWPGGQMRCAALADVLPDYRGSGCNVSLLVLLALSAISVLLTAESFCLEV